MPAKEMDALIMNGINLRSGSVAAVSGLRNPISLARKVMENTPHCMLVAEGANAFAREQGIVVTRVNILYIRAGFAFVAQDELVTEGAKKEFEEYKQQYQTAVSSLFNSETSPATKTGCDTVGAVAFDSQRNLASGTSTGGITFASIHSPLDFMRHQWKACRSCWRLAHCGVWWFC